MSEIDISMARETIRKWNELAQAALDESSEEFRRDPPRTDWVVPMELNVDGDVLYVRSRDISGEGLGLTCRAKLDEGKLVQVRQDQNEPWVPARIVHATQTIGGHKLGVTLKFEV